MNTWPEIFLDCAKSQMVDHAKQLVHVTNDFYWVSIYSQEKTKPQAQEGAQIYIVYLEPGAEVNGHKIRVGDVLFAPDLNSLQISECRHSMLCYMKNTTESEKQYKTLKVLSKNYEHLVGYA